jgi:hypothetical protein
VAAAALLAASLAILGGCETPSPHTINRNVTLRPDLPGDPPEMSESEKQDCIQGGQLYKYYCGSCHNARPLGERPFSNYHVAVTHMRGQAYLTGEEYRQILVFLRRWQDVGPSTPPVKPSPKRMVFSQPIAELSKDSSPVAPAPPAGPGAFQGQGAEAPAPPAQPGAAEPSAPAPAANPPLPLN